MNDRKKLSVDECIEGLQWKVLRAIEDNSGVSLYVRLIVIRTETGIKDKLASAEGESTYEHTFTGRLLESLLYEECVEYKRYGGNRVWCITDKGSEKHERINETQRCDLEDFIYGLEEVLLDAMIELRGGSDYIRLKHIADKCGFEDKLPNIAGEPVFNNYFTHTLLHYLLRERRVHKSRTRRGEWKLTDSELQKRQK